MIEAVIFDWAGTTVDYGCFAPVQAFIEAFAHYQIPVTMEETRKPMGMLKIEHIRTMLKMERIAKLWEEKYGRTAGEADAQAIYEQFEPKLLSILSDFAAPKPHVLEAVAALRQMGVKIGSTTGYTDKMMAIVVPEAAKAGYSPDCWFSADSTGGQGRPFPYMIFKNLQELKVASVRSAVKVGDTISDIQEGVNAGVWTVGVIEGSSLLGLRQEELESMTGEDRNRCIKQAEYNFREAGAHFVIRNLSQLPELIRVLGA